MSIPKRANRDKAFQEIHRVLKPGGLFIFTTHDRVEEPEYLDFWRTEKVKWERQEQDKQLFEFGDLITASKNESRSIFIHIPDQLEIQQQLEAHQFELVETFYRSERFTETEEVKAKSGECRFWVARKR